MIDPPMRVSSVFDMRDAVITDVLIREHRALWQYVLPHGLEQGSALGIRHRLCHYAALAFGYSDNNRLVLLSLVSTQPATPATFPLPAKISLVYLDRFSLQLHV